MHHLVCITGLVGSGKSVVSDYFVNHEKYLFFRFGQLVIDEIKNRRLPLIEDNQKLVREEFRRKHGMAAMAILNLGTIENLLSKGNVIGDGLYSFEEYKVLKEKFGSQLILIAVFAPPQLRYQRVSRRKSGKDDTSSRNHEFTLDQARKRDIHELENLNKGATIAMADYTLINTGDIETLHAQIREFINILS